MSSINLIPRGRKVRRRFRISRVGVSIAVIAFLVLSGTGAYAYWSVSTGMKFTTSVATGTLVVDTSWSTLAPVEYTNEPASLKQMMYFTVENNTLNNGASRVYDVVLDYSGATADPNPVRTALVLTIWKTDNSATNCGTEPPMTGTVTKSWKDFPLAIPLSGTLGAKGSVGPPPNLVPLNKDKWCIYSSVAERSALGSDAGAVQLTPKITATLKAGTWTASSIKVTNSTGNGPVQKTKAIYSQKPSERGIRQIKAANGLCLDVSQANGAANNVSVIQYTCSTTKLHQRWSGAPVGLSGNDAKYVTFAPSAPSGKKLSGPGPITVQGPSGGEEQQWQIQQRPSGVFQLVNRKTGLCLTSPNNTVGDQFITASCDGLTAAQGFTFSAAIVETLTCDDKSGFWPLYDKWDYNFYSWTTPSSPGDRISVRGTSYDLPLNPGSTSFSIWEGTTGSPPSLNFSPGANKTYSVDIKNTSNEVYATGQIKTSDSWFSALGIYVDCN